MEWSWDEGGNDDSKVVTRGEGRDAARQTARGSEVRCGKWKKVREDTHGYSKADIEHADHCVLQRAS